MKINLKIHYLDNRKYKSTQTEIEVKKVIESEEDLKKLLAENARKHLLSLYPERPKDIKITSINVD